MNIQSLIPEGDSLVTPYLHPKAEKQLRNIRGDLRQQIDERINDLIADYSAFSKILTAGLKGLRSIHVSSHRIVFCVCKECQKNGWLQINKLRCGCCGNLPKDALHIIAIGPRKNIYDRI
jgi:mRNA-degrading endonuclease RelE of RelBE toxin-antitoxin system